MDAETDINKLKDLSVSKDSESLDLELADDDENFEEPKKIRIKTNF